jgi:hypothetical protein
MKTSDWSSFLQNQLPYNDRQSDDILEYNNMVTQPLDQGSIISFTHNVSTSVYQCLPVIILYWWGHGFAGNLYQMSTSHKFTVTTKDGRSASLFSL